MPRGRPIYSYPDPHSALIAEVALSLGVNRSTISIWRSRHCVSHIWRLPIYREVRRRGIDLPDEAFDRFAEPPGEPSRRMTRKRRR